LLMLKSKDLAAMLAWLSRHLYHLTKEADIQSAFFQGKDFGKNVESITVDWLAENYNAPGQVALHPSPEYDKHIIEVK
jgi:hypothetical protein